MRLELSALALFLSIVTVVVTVKKRDAKNQRKVPCSGTLGKQRTPAYSMSNTRIRVLTRGL